MIVERIDSIEGFDLLRNSWNELYARDPESQFFLSWEWMSGVLRTNPGAWLLLVARDPEGRCAGVLPLRIRTIWSKSRHRIRNELQFAGRLFWADYGGVLCDPDQEEQVLVALANTLRAMCWSQLRLKGFLASDRRLTLFMKAMADERLQVEYRSSHINDGQTDNLVCPFIELPDSFETYLGQSVSSNTRQKIRRFLRRIEAGDEYTVSVTDSGTQSRDLEAFAGLWRRSWSAEKGADTDRIAAKYRMILKQGLDAGLVHMPVLWSGERPVGMLASFVDRARSRLLFFVTARDEEFEEFPAGLVLHAWNIRWAIENGIRIYDFLRGDEPYKRSLGAAQGLRLSYPVITTRTGLNLNEGLDPGCLNEALKIADDFSNRGQIPHTRTICGQVLAAVSSEETAQRLLRTMQASAA